MKDKYKIVSFVGSLAGEKSHTRRISDRMAEVIIRKAAEAGIEASYECIAADQVRIDYCRSCNSCFIRGVCPLDSVDDMGRLKDAFLGADIIIFGTPVYMNEMSGVAKSCIDRTAYWAHRCELAGKACVAIASTDYSMGPDLDKRISMLLESTGLAVTDCLVIKNSASPHFWIEEELQPLLAEAAERVLDAAQHPEQYITAWQEASWLYRMNVVKHGETFSDLTGLPPADEVRVCLERGLPGYASLKEYIISKGEQDVEL